MLFHCWPVGIALVVLMALSLIICLLRVVELVFGCRDFVLRISLLATKKKVVRAGGGWRSLVLAGGAWFSLVLAGP